MSTISVPELHDLLADPATTIVDALDGEAVCRAAVILWPIDRWSGL